MEVHLVEDFHRTFVKLFIVHGTTYCTIVRFKLLELLLYKLKSEVLMTWDIVSIINKLYVPGILHPIYPFIHPSYPQFNSTFQGSSPTYLLLPLPALPAPPPN